MALDKNPENRELVLEGLKMTGRMDLVGFGPKCLIRPRELHKKAKKTQTRSSAHERYQKKKMSSGSENNPAVIRSLRFFSLLK